jgi:hypothetical protein
MPTILHVELLHQNQVLWLYCRTGKPAINTNAESHSPRRNRKQGPVTQPLEMPGAPLRLSHPQPLPEAEIKGLTPCLAPVGVEFAEPALPVSDGP